MQDAWNDLVLEGPVISKEQDNSNIPVYAPSMQDFNGGGFERAARYQKILHVYSGQQSLASKISSVLGHVNGCF